MPATSRLSQRLVVSAGALVVAAACAPTPAPVTTTRTPWAHQSTPVRAETGAIPWGLVVHGGAGSRTPPRWSEPVRAAREAGMARALEAGYAVLARGGSALDAVQAAIVVLEDDSLFNAGRGAVFTADGRNELDAAVMDGPELRVGAVAGITRVRNPITLARTVMERSEHVMMVGEGAERFAREAGMELVDPSWFRTEAAWRALENERAAEQRRRDSAAARTPEGASASDGGSYHGTVGAVALDRQGRLAAGTSTGGRTNKRYGRVGDVPIIGAGTYANPRCAVSATGHGEWFIRYTVARDICARVEEGMNVAASADSIMFGIFDPIPVDGGVIVLDNAGNLAMSFNSAVMPRGWIGPDGRPRVWLTAR